MKQISIYFPFIVLLLLGGIASYSFAAETLPGNDTPNANRSYTIENLPLPAGETTEVASIALLPEDKIAITTRRGEVWIGAGLYDTDLAQVTWSLFAQGLHEGFGSFWRDGGLFVLQHGELTKLTDTTNDGKADTFETINDDWGSIHNIHEFAFGSLPDKNGDVWAALCLTGSSRSASPFRGWAVRITPEGKMIPTVSGIRSPGGIGFDHEGVTFYTDNQGHWNGSSSLKPLLPGTFVGNPTGNVWYRDAPEMGPLPEEPVSGSSILNERARVEEFVPPAVIFPHGEVGQSPTGVLSDSSGGKFGPFNGQMLVGEITHSQVQRVMMEQVNGVYQGAVVNFLSGIDFGVVPMRMNQEKGTLFVGGTNRGWGSRGEQGFGLARVRWNGKTPFALHNITLKEKGFELTFTEPVKEDSIKTVSVGSFGYIYQSGYGSPVINEKEHELPSQSLSKDGRKLTITVDEIAQGSVHQVRLTGLENKKGEPIEHGDAYYTVNEIPLGAGVTRKAGKPPWKERWQALEGKPNPEEKQQIESALPTPSVATKKARRILAFYRCEGAVHKSIPYANHAFEAIAEKHKPFTVDTSDDYAIFEPDTLAKYDAIVFNNTTNLNLDDKQKAAILGFVKGGKGIVGIHAASDNFKKWEEGYEMIGGVFDGHPWGSGGTWAFKVEDPEHPLNHAFKGSGFWAQDEIYQYRPESFQGREKLRVLLSLDMSHPENAVPLEKIKFKGNPQDIDNPVSWCHSFGEGRVFYTNLGHRAETFSNPICLQHILDGTQYALGDLAASDVPSKLASPGIKIAGATKVIAPEIVIPKSIEEVRELFPTALRDRKSWKLSASHNEKMLRNAIDGDRASRYTTRARMEPGMWLQVELPKATAIDGILLETLASTGDFPRDYRVEISDDGENWDQEVAQGKGQPWTEIRFPPITTKYLRIIQEGNTGPFWSVHELEILGVAE